MKLRDFRIGWRLLVGEPAYSAVVILGLTIGFAVCFLLLGLVRHSFSYDRQVPASEAIFILKQRWNGPGTHGGWNQNASLPARDGIVASGLPVLATTFITRAISVRAGAQVQTIGLSVVDPDFQKIFSPEVIAGDLDAALTRPDAIALSEETAVKLFGSRDAVGKSVQVAGAPYLVSAVLADQPAASTMPFAALTGIKTSIWPAQYRQLVTTNWGSSHGPVYVRPGQGVPPAAVADAVRRAFLASAFYQRLTAGQLAGLGGKDPMDFKLGPLREAYLDPEVRSGSANHGDRQGVLGLAAVGLLILLLAATNYVNLATVRTLRRQREIAVRKVLGAGAGAVSRQFLAESILVCLIATAFGLLLAWLLLPAFSSLVQRKLDLLFTPSALIASAALGIALGVAAGAYPAWSALKVHPSAALAGRGNAETPGGLWLRRVLTVLQFATAMGLSGLTLAVAWQTSYARRLDPGFDPAPLLVVATASDLRSASAFRDALRRLPGVSAVAAADAPVTVNRNSTPLQREGGTPIEINYFEVSPEFFDVYGLKPVAGRLYSAAMDTVGDGDRIVINAAGARKLGFDSPQAALGKYVGNPDGSGTPLQVVGVAPDIGHRSAREDVQATIYYLSERTGVFTLRTTGDLAQLHKAVEDIWPRFFPNDVLDMQRVDGSFAASYADDLRLAKLLAASSVIATAIAAFGIYVLSAYSVQRRSREIVLRKMHGAGRAAIARLLGQEFALLIGIGALLGVPLAWLGTEHYLAGFVERAAMGIWPSAAALALAALVALGATTRHTLAAMRIAPALALRE